MPPLEVLKDVFGALTRDDLDMLMLVKSAFLNVVRRDFAKGPYRVVLRLKVSNYNNNGVQFAFYVPSRTTSQQSVYADSEDFGRWIAFCRIKHLYVALFVRCK